MLARARHSAVDHGAKNRSSTCHIWLLLLAVVAACPFIWLITGRLPSTSLQQPRLVDRLKSHSKDGTVRAATSAGDGAGYPSGDRSSTTDVPDMTVFSRTPAHVIQAAARYQQEVVLSPRSRPAVPPSKYVIGPEPYHMRVQHKKVAAYLASPAFKAKVAARKSGGRRGIIINAGGPALLTSAIVTLKVLREVHKCHLPVELVWHRQGEMDKSTLVAMQDRWGPLTGLDLSSMPWPEHQRRLPGAAGGQQSKLAAKFAGKVMSLTVSSFASALLLDADNLPLANPESLWEDRGFQAQGNLFWPDFWSSAATSSVEAEHQEVVFDMVGLQYKQALELLSAGKGRLSSRDSESGQLLLDLVAHADVAEWALWINSFGDEIYRAVWGDKDTYGLAFAVAGKAHKFTQLQVPPGAALSWRPQRLLVKASQQLQDGWQLAGMVQFDAYGQPAFLHRTMNKFSWGGEAWPIQHMTGPLPDSWIHYYLSLDALGPTVGVPYDYVVPDAALHSLGLLHSANALKTGVSNTATVLQDTQGCPVQSFIPYWNLRQQALPIGSSTDLDAACKLMLSSMLGPTTATEYEQTGLLDHPELLMLSASKFDWALMGLKGSSHTGDHFKSSADIAADPSPVLAFDCTGHSQQSVVRTFVTESLAGSYEAYHWLTQHASEFPVIGGVSNLSANAA